jgi:transposase
MNHQEDIMRARLFSETEINLLSKNKNVVSVSTKSITYNPIFKLFAVIEYQSGKPPMEIFRDAGFDIDMIGKRNPHNSLARWRKVYENLGEDGLLKETRGNNNRVSDLDLSDTEKLKKAQAKIAYLEAELDFLKKLEVLERQVIN